MFRLALLVADFPKLAEIEINPLRVLPKGEGAFTLNVCVRLVETRTLPKPYVIDRA
jgi:hypothetical protein